MESPNAVLRSPRLESSDDDMDNLNNEVDGVPQKRKPRVWNKGKLGKGNDKSGSPDSDDIEMDQLLRDTDQFIHDVSQFYNQQALSDVVLRVSEEDTFYAHKFVLAKSSDVFKAMLYEHNGAWAEHEQSELELNETPECNAVFDKFLRYLYTAEIQVNVNTAVGILCLADKYCVQSLKNLIVDYMIEHSRSPKVENALNWYSWARGLHLESLVERCRKTIAWNFNDIMQSQNWATMDIEFLCDFLSNSELIIPNEFVIWEAICRWLLEDDHDANFVKHAEQLFPLIRFPQMMVSHLYEIENSDFALQAGVKDILLDLINQAYRFRALAPSQKQLEMAFGNDFYYPRDYSDLIVDNLRMQNVLRFGIQVEVKMYRGPVPSTDKFGEWKLNYRKQNNTWSLLLYGHETAMLNGEARVQLSVVVSNDKDKVIQVHREPTTECERGTNVTIAIDIEQPEQAKYMSVLLKPVPL